jgi:two-component system nitrate/nitrite response regulator NarL
MRGETLNRPAVTSGLANPKACSMPQVYIVSDVRLHREGLLAMLAQHRRLKVRGAGCSREVMTQIADLRPEVLLLDLTANGSLSIPRRAMQILPALRVVAFAVSEVEADIFACAEAGICGYVRQDGSLEDLVAAVLRALKGELVCSPRMAALLFRRVADLSRGQSATLSAAPLTRREREIAELVAGGLANKEIARKLHLGPATIKNHVHNILQKLNIRRRGEIAALHLQLPAGSGVQKI